MKVTFELDDKDLKHFQREMQKARKRVRTADEDDILQATEDVLQDVRGLNKVPDFVKHRLTKLDNMIGMLKDPQWNLPKTERGRVINALVYFADPDDLIPDEIPGIGLLDDAIMIELVFRELTHELEAYDDFCRFRELQANDDPNLDMRLKTRRKALLERIRRRKKKDSRTKLLSSLW